MCCRCVAVLMTLYLLVPFSYTETSVGGPYLLKIVKKYIWQQCMLYKMIWKFARDLLIIMLHAICISMYGDIVIKRTNVYKTR